MSNKAKNLTYEMEEPAFLRRLRQQHAGGGGPDRYIAPRNRKTAVDDDEDAPTYVLEGAENKTISTEEFKAMAGEDEAEADPEQFGEEVEGGGEADNTGTSGKEDMRKTRRENITDIGIKGKKRKAAKIVSNDETEEKEEKVEDKKGKTKAGKKTKKPVKLSFDED